MIETGKDRRSLEDFWKIIWRRKWVVGLFVLSVMAAVTMGILVLTPIFEASATLHVKEQMPSVLGTDFWGTGISDLSPATEINTQMEILKSSSVLMDAIATPGLALRFVPKADLGDDERLRLAVESLKKSLSVTSVTNTRLIRVAVRSKDPELAMQITNAICRAFIKRNVESKRSEANAVLAFVSDQVSQVSASLDRAEEDLLRYKQTEHITILADEAKLKLDRLAELESQYQQVKLDRQILQARINGVQRLNPNKAALESVADTPSVKALQDRLTAVESDFSRLKPGDPSAELLRQQADSLERDIQAEIERALEAEKGEPANSVLQLQLAEYTSRDIILSAQEEVLRKQIAVDEADISRLSTQEINLFKLERARRINDELYSALMKAKNEAQIEAISQIGSIDVIDPAVIPIDPVSPRKRENLIVGFLLSLLMGVCFTFLLEYFDNTVKSEEEAKKLLGIPLLGHIPKFQTNGSLTAKKRNGGNSGVSTRGRRSPRLSACCG